MNNRTGLPLTVVSALFALLGSLGPQAHAAAPQRAAPQLVGRPIQAPGAPRIDLPTLPPLDLDSDRTSLVDADRFPVSPAPGDTPILAATATLVDAILDRAFTGTGFDEYYQYQVPPGYDADGPAIPLLIAYHGFGSSAASVAEQTLLDELCALNGWFYLSVTGVDDKLFGTPVAQQNVDAVVQWTLDNHFIDEDRIYMVGFSMGAGIAANYAATHRDPDGIMIAALGLVSGAYDWAMSFELDPAVQPLMLNPFNFGTSPRDDAFVYQAASALFHDLNSYPPAPGTLTPMESMAHNLVTTPVYATWDTFDSISYLPAQTETLVSHLSSLGGDVTSREVANTVNPADGQPATHSWAVLDEYLLFHFLDGRQLERRPTDLDMLFTEDSQSSFLDITQRAAGALSSARATSDPAAKTVTLHEATNVAEAAFGMTDAGLAHVWPVRIDATVTEPADLVLTIEDDLDLPGYLVDPITGDLVPGAEWDPDARTLSLTLPASSTSSFLAECPHWGSAMSVSPDPVVAGGTFELRVDSPASSPGSVWMVLSMDEELFTLGGGLALAISPFPPAILQPIPLNPDGSLSLTLTMPADPGLVGARLPLQGVVVSTQGFIVDATNPFALDVQ